jgi:hypothetical protein
MNMVPMTYPMPHTSGPHRWSAFSGLNVQKIEDLDCGLCSWCNSFSRQNCFFICLHACMNFILVQSFQK